MNNLSSNEWASNSVELVVVGAGRVGLPLAIALAESGTQVRVVDKDGARCDAINARRPPFVEPGLAEALRSTTLSAQTDFEVVSEASTVIVSVGTPVLAHFEADVSPLRGAIREIAPYLKPGHLLVVRSTLAPGTMRLVAGWIRELTPLEPGHTLFLAYCPERLSEGNALDELRSLPQIVGSEDEESASRAEAVFAKLASSVLHTSSADAELAKLFNNAARYAEFAIANELASVAERLGRDYYEVRRVAASGYPRGVGPLPGLTAGVCLRKDFAMLAESSAGVDLFTAAWRVHESMPLKLIEGADRRQPLEGARVGIIGVSFKGNVDDTRDSLAMKLYRQLLRRGPANIHVADSMNIGDLDIEGVGVVTNEPIHDIINECDVVFIGANHDADRRAIFEAAQAAPSVLFVDLWNSLGIQQTYFRGAQLTAQADQLVLMDSELS